MTYDVAIIGGGFSGSLLAARLVRLGQRVALIERSGIYGLGVAYSTSNDSHLLNVRAGRMSAFPETPDHFVQWLSATGLGPPDSEAFVPRRVYGRYVQSILEVAEQECPARLDRFDTEAVSIGQEGIGLADGRTLSANATVLATGNPRATEPSRSGRVVADLWMEGALDHIELRDHVILIGSGLTMVDALLSLEDKGWLGEATVISRRGLLPEGHAASQTAIGSRRPAPGRLSSRLKAFRKRAEEVGWHSAMDELRDITTDLWRDLSIEERRQFIRHLRPWWDVHRHRMAPEVRARMERLKRMGRLHVRAGHVDAINEGSGGVEVTWRPRGARFGRQLSGSWLVNCTGYSHDPAHSPSRLVRSLLENGAARRDPVGLGLDVDANGGVIDLTGRARGDLFVLGPPAVAAFWETIAVPDIARSAQRLARHLRGAY